MPSILAAAAMEQRAGGTLKATIQVLELGPVNGLEAALQQTACKLGHPLLYIGGGGIDAWSLFDRLT